jgi:surfeit locus 1 family protein
MTAFSKRGRFWVVSLAALLTVALTFSLGQWQLRRAAQKQALQASLDQKSQVAALGNAGLAGLAVLNPPALAALSERRVDITGQWQAAQTVYLDNRPMNGRPGFWVMTPLQLSGTDKVVLVQRGWIPRDFVDRSRLAPVETSSQEVRLQGRMAPAPAKLYAFKGADTGLIRQNLDIGVLAAETGLPLLPVLVLQTGPASEGLQREWAAPNTGIDKHHGYAFQWFGLSALVLGLYVWFQWVVPLRRRSKAL